MIGDYLKTFYFTNDYFKRENHTLFSNLGLEVLSEKFKKAACSKNEWKSFITPLPQLSPFT